MQVFDIHSKGFKEAAAAAGLRARENALAAGHYVVFLDEVGRYVQEMPDGRLLEIRFDSDAPRESHLHVIRELRPSVR